MPKRSPAAPEALPSTPAVPEEGEGRLHISRYRASRHFALYDGKDLVAVTVYRKGAEEAIRERLETDTRTIADVQRQVAGLEALTPRCHEQAAQPSWPMAGDNDRGSCSRRRRRHRDAHHPL